MSEGRPHNDPPPEDDPEEILKDFREDQKDEIEADKDRADRANEAAEEARGINQAGIEAEQEQPRKEAKSEYMPPDDAQAQRDANSEGAD